MTKLFVPLAIVAALGLAACSQKAQNEANEAANTMAADANATPRHGMKPTRSTSRRWRRR